MYDVLVVHVFHTLTDLSHVRDAIGLRKIVIFLNQTVEKFSSRQAVKCRVKLTYGKYLKISISFIVKYYERFPQPSHDTYKPYDFNAANFRHHSK